MNEPKLCTKECQEKSPKNCLACDAHKTPEQLNDIAIEINNLTKDMCADDDSIRFLINTLKLQNAVNDFINYKLSLLIRQ